MSDQSTGQPVLFRTRNGCITCRLVLFNFLFEMIPNSNKLEEFVELNVLRKSLLVCDVLEQEGYAMDTPQSRYLELN
jgi:hypothetical protein